MQLPLCATSVLLVHVVMKSHSKNNTINPRSLKIPPVEESLYN